MTFIEQHYAHLLNMEKYHYDDALRTLLDDPAKAREHYLLSITHRGLAEGFKIAVLQVLLPEKSQGWDGRPGRWNRTL